MLRKTLKPIYISVWCVVLLICLIPLGTIGFQSISHQDIFSLLFSPYVLRTLKMSLGLGIASLFFSLFLAIPLSYLLSRTNIPWKRPLLLVLGFPFVIPSYLFAIAWVVLALPKVGLLNRVFDDLNFNIYSFSGLVWVTCNAFLPLLTNSLSKSFDSMDPSLEEAARISGAGPFRTFLKITIPCLFPSILGTSLVFFFTVLSSFGIPAIIGNPAKLFVLTTQIFTVSKMGGLKGAEEGFVISLWLILIALLLGGVGRFLRQKYQVSLVGGKASRHSLVDLGFLKWPLFGVGISGVFLLVFLPLGALFISSLMKIPGELSWSNFSFENYLYLFRMKEGPVALINSVTLAVLGSLTCCGIGFFVAYFSQRSQIKSASILERAASIPFSIPGTVVGLAFIVSFGTGWGFQKLSFLGTPFILFVAYVAKDLAIAINHLIPALGQIDKSLDESARISGAGELAVIDKILFPLSFPALQVVFGLCALPMLTELTMSVLLYGPGTETLGTLIFQLQDYSNPQAACALASLLVVGLALVMLAFGSLSQKQK